MTNWELAQYNIATMRYESEDNRLAGFFARIEEINQLADSADGFVWRLDDDSADTSVVASQETPNLVMNLSVWSSIEALHAFVYRTSHSELIAKRKDWFERPIRSHQVLWWIPKTHRPDLAEGAEKLAVLERLGPTAEAFTFKAPFYRG